MGENKTGNRAWIWIVVIVVAVMALIGACLIGGIVGWLIGQAPTQAEAPSTTPPYRVPRPETPSDTPIQVPRATPLLPEPVLPATPGAFSGAALIRVVHAGTPAEEADLRTGDVITAVDGRPLSQSFNLADAIGQHEPGDTVALSVWRGGQARDIEVVLAEKPGDTGQPYLGVDYAPIQVHERILPQGD